MPLFRNDLMVRTRFAPSPTGTLHLGGARTALFNWLFARHHGGNFLLRIEDTDRERSTEENVSQIIEALHWLGLNWDGEPVLQSQRAKRHRECIRALVDTGHAYHCDCSPERLQSIRKEQEQQKIKPRYDRHCRDRDVSPSDSTVVRFRTPAEGEVVVEDSLKGIVRFQNAELDDLVIARADGSATYHLAVVVDDIDTGITHILRGDDHLNNTPRQTHIFTALGAAVPQYTHLPMILDEQGKKLSKRSGAADVLSWRKQGFLPSAMINILARMGWSHGDEELFSREDLVRLFDLDTLNSSPARLNEKKSLWVNQQQMKSGPWKEIEKEFLWNCEKLNFPIDSLPSEKWQALLTVQRQRCRRASELVEQSFWMLGKNIKINPAAQEKFCTPEALQRMREFLPELEGEASWSAEALNARLQAYLDANELKPALLAQPLRVAITGNTVSPSIGDTMALLGRELSLARLHAVLDG